MKENPQGNLFCSYNCAVSSVSRTPQKKCMEFDFSSFLCSCLVTLNSSIFVYFSALTLMTVTDAFFLV